MLGRGTHTKERHSQNQVERISEVREGSPTSSLEACEDERTCASSSDRSSTFSTELNRACPLPRNLVLSGFKRIDQNDGEPQDDQRGDRSDT